MGRWYGIYARTRIRVSIFHITCANSENVKKCSWFLALGPTRVHTWHIGRNNTGTDPQTEHNMTTLHEALTARFTDATEISDIANHGCAGGVNSFIWNHEVAEFFDQYEEEIYDYLNDCDLSMKDFVKDNGATITTLKVNMVWTVVELWCQAQHMANEMVLVAA